MRRCNARTILVLLFAVLPLLPGARAGAQGVPAADGPRFLFSASADAQPVEIDASRIAALGRKVSLTLDNVRLEDALDQLSLQAGVRFVYVGSVLPLDKRVQFRSENITVATALTELLFGLRVDVVARGGSQLALVRREPEPAAQADTGAIVGRVTDAESGNPIVNAQVALDGRGRALTAEDGRYRIDGVMPGRRTVSVTHVGYARVAQETDVGDGATVTVDFSLEVSPSQLDEVVVTVTGEQRVRELGHVVARINVDSLVKEAPVSNITEILTGRIPGVQVFQTQGIVGGDVQLQIRTPNSMLLSAQPIVIVDGVRHTSTPALDPGRRSGTRYGEGVILGSGATAARVEATSPLNDLNPNDIETIEVVKGSAAATLYGTDASNGVIVITTKRGDQGPARWNAYVRGGINETPRIPQPDSYFGWGTQPDGLPFQANCSLYRIASGACAQDSITVVSNPLNDPSQTIFANAPQWEYGLNASGGGAGVQYYIGGSLQRQIGSLRMPAALADSIEEARGEGMAAEQSRPNALTNINLRSNLTAALGEQIQLQGNIGYVRRKNRTIAVSNPYLYAADVEWQDPTNLQRSPKLTHFCSPELTPVVRSLVHALSSCSSW